MTWLCGYNAAFERTAYKRKVAKHIEQLVASRLIVIHKWLVVQVAQLVHVLVLHMHQVGELVQVLLLHGTVIYHNRIVKVTTLYKVILHKRQNFSHKHKCAAGGYLFLEIAQIVERRKLVRQNGGVKRNHSVY